MKLKKFVQFINEKYSIPNSIDKLSDDATTLITNKFVALFKKGFIGKKQIKFVPTNQYEDFPLQEMYVDLIMDYDPEMEDGKLDRSGAAKVIGKGKSKIIDNKVITHIKIFLYVPTKTKKLTFETLYSELNSIICHEMLHTYQSYKETINGTATTGLNDLSRQFLQIIYNSDKNYQKNKFLHDVFLCCYMICSKYETSAFLSMIHKPEKWLNDLKNILKLSKEEFYNKCEENFRLAKFTDDVARTYGFIDVGHLIQIAYKKISTNGAKVYHKILKVEYIKDLK